MQNSRRRRRLQIAHRSAACLLGSAPEPPFSNRHISWPILASLLQSSGSEKSSRSSPLVWRKAFGDGLGKRFLASFIGGILVLFGARLAGGCTSGHMISGMMQTSISGYLFALGAFAIAVPVAMFLFKERN